MIKKFLLFTGCITCLSTAFAQNKANTYSISVFKNARIASVSDDKLLATSEAAATSFPGWSIEMDKPTGHFRDMYGKAIKMSGSGVTEWVNNAITQKLNDLDVNADEWQQTSTAKTDKAIFASYVQTFAGHTVVFSKLSFRFTPAGELIRVQMKNYGKPADATLTLAAADAAKAAIADLSGINVTSNEINEQWEWFPIPSASGYVLHPAWHFTVKGSTQSNAPIQLSGYVDATNGNILYRTNEIKDAFDLTVKGNVYKDGTSYPATLQPLTDLALTIAGNTYYTDTAGYYSNSGLVLPTTTNVGLSGRWSVVNDVPTSTTPSFNTSVTAIGTTYTFPITAPASSRHINAYYHVNRVHNFMKLQFPAFTGMDIALPTNVDLGTGTCNAFYNGSSINFYAAGGGCVSFANIGSVIYHEYGHGITDKYYTMINHVTIQNSALNEGMSDVWAMCITHSPIIGENAYTAGGDIRRYDVTSLVFPKDITGEPHNDGEIIAGAWWDVSVNLGNVDSMAKLFTGCYNEASDGPDGTEGNVYHGVLISALLNDDNDNNLSNGTPHFRQIVSAFAKHGIYLLYDATIAHKELAHQAAGAPISVSANLTVFNTFFFSNLKLLYKVRGTSAWDTVLMTNTSGTTYMASMPAQTKGTIIDYYIALQDTMQYTDVYLPKTYNPAANSLQNSIPYQFGVGLNNRYSNTFEDSSDVTNWRIGNNTGDNATGGIWIWAVPVQSFVRSDTGNIICQTGHDHTTGSGKCLVTGNAASYLGINTNDVDYGKTTVITPTFDLTDYHNPIIEYYRWYGDDMGDNPSEDLWQVQVRDTTSAIWKYVDQTYRSDYSWRRRIFALKEYLASKSNIQFKFIAQDPSETGLYNNGQSAVEAAIDDFFIYDDVPADVATVVPTKASIYPNPANDKLEISMAQAGTSGNIGLYDISGKQLSTMQLNLNTTHYELDTRPFASGHYFLVIQTGKSIQSQQVVIKH